RGRRAPARSHLAKSKTPEGPVSLRHARVPVWLLRRRAPQGLRKFIKMSDCQDNLTSRHLDKKIIRSPEAGKRTGMPTPSIRRQRLPRTLTASLWRENVWRENVRQVNAFWRFDCAPALRREEPTLGDSFGDLRRASALADSFEFGAPGSGEFFDVGRRSGTEERAFEFKLGARGVTASEKCEAVEAVGFQPGQVCPDAKLTGALRLFVLFGFDEELDETSMHGDVVLRE